MTIIQKFGIIYKMIKFNWKRLNNFFSWEKRQVLKYFYYLADIPYYGNRINASDIEKIKRLQTYKDNYSLLIGYDRLLTENSDIDKIYNYIEISSCRNYFDFSVRKIDWIYRWQIPKSIKLDNPLIRVVNDKVYLKYDSSQQE